MTKLQNEEVMCLNTLKTLLMNWTDNWMSEKLLMPEKSCLYYNILTLTKLKYFMTYTTAANEDMFWARNNKSSAKGLETTIYIHKMLIKRWIFDYSDEIEIGFLFTNFYLIFWNMFGGLCTQVFIHGYR